MDCLRGATPRFLSSDIAWLGPEGAEIGGGAALVLGDEVCGEIFYGYAGEDSSPVHVVGASEPLVDNLFPWCLAGVSVVEEPHDAYRSCVVFPFEEP